MPVTPFFVLSARGRVVLHARGGDRLLCVPALHPLLSRPARGISQAGVLGALPHGAGGELRLLELSDKTLSRTEQEVVLTVVTPLTLINKSLAIFHVQWWLALLSLILVIPPTPFPHHRGCLPTSAHVYLRYHVFFPRLSGAERPVGVGAHRLRGLFLQDHAQKSVRGRTFPVRGRALRGEFEPLF